MFRLNTEVSLPQTLEEHRQVLCGQCSIYLRLVGFELCIATKDFPQLLLTSKSPTLRVRRSLIEPLPGMIHRKRTLAGLDVKKMENGVGHWCTISAKEVADHRLAGLHREIAYTYRRASGVTEG